MTTATRTTKAGTIRRTITLSAFALAAKIEARVCEDNGKKIVTDSYLLSRQPSDFGIAFTVQKCEDDGEQYDVLLNAPGGGHTCDCKWATYKGHIKPCRHIEMAVQAVRESKL